MSDVMNPGVADRLIEHLREGTTDVASSDLFVPIEHFVSDRRAVLERDLLKRLPTVLAHASEVAEAGSFITRDIMGVPLLIVRQNDGSVAAYLNICRHRGGRVEREESGAKRVFVCGYHGWSYDRDGGDLRNVPFEKFFDPIDKACNGLQRVPVEERHGLVWGLLAADGSLDLTDYLGPKVEEQLASLGMSDTIVHIDQQFAIDVNWKLVMDGAVDILHPKFLHPTGVGKLVQTNSTAWNDYGRHGQLFTPRRRMEELAKSGEPIDDPWRYYGANLVVFPNTMVIAAPDHVEFWSVWPDPESPTRSTTHIRLLVRPEILDDRIRGRVERSWEILKHAAMEEDWPMELTIQANALARPEGTFRYGRNEITCQHLHLRLAEELGEPLSS